MDRRPGLGVNGPASASAIGGVRITLMMPAYNEEQDLPGLLERIEHALAGWANYRVLIVDDGSKDRTAAIAREAAQRMPVELIQHQRNQGLGAAIRTGLRAAAAGEGVVVTMDADNSQDPALIRAMVERLGQGFDVVIASRFQPGSKEVGVPPFRLFLSHLSSAGIRILAPYPGARDYTCGFRAYRVEALRKLIAAFGDEAFLRENGFACMLELLLNLRVVGARVAEVPLVLRYDLKAGASKMRVMRTIWRYTVTMARASVPAAWRVRKGVTVASPR
jgi:dolichol-phosphate mannosyltransferase